MKINYTFGKAGIATVLLAALTGCTTYVVQRPEPQPAYVPPPAQVVVQDPPPAPVIIEQPAPPPPAVVVIQREDDFYEPLSPYGEWVVVGTYGRVWRPARVETNWRPYANGHWELTGDGWYWVSDEPWAWATYHYGRWQLVSGYGWVWVPQTQWAPAWVSWREGGGYVGWAPLPPEPRGGVSVNVTIAPAAFCYVEERHMHEPVRPTTVIVNNTTIINKTVNITKTKVVNKVVVNEGPRRDEVERATGKKIQQTSIAELRQKEEEPVAEKHQNLRALKDRGQQPEQKPEQKQPKPAPVAPPPSIEPHPADNRNNRPQNPPAKPIVREVTPKAAEQTPAALTNKERQQQQQAEREQQRQQQQQQKLQEQVQKQQQLQQQKQQQQEQKQKEQEQKQQQQLQQQQQQERAARTAPQQNTNVPATVAHRSNPPVAANPPGPTRPKIPASPRPDKIKISKARQLVPGFFV